MPKRLLCSSTQRNHLQAWATCPELLHHNWTCTKNLQNWVKASASCRCSHKPGSIIRDIQHSKCRKISWWTFRSTADLARTGNRSMRATTRVVRQDTIRFAGDRATASCCNPLWFLKHLEIRTERSENKIRMISHLNRNATSYYQMSPNTLLKTKRNRNCRCLENPLQRTTILRKNLQSFRSRSLPARRDKLHKPQSKAQDCGMCCNNCTTRRAGKIWNDPLHG